MDVVLYSWHVVKLLLPNDSAVMKNLRRPFTALHDALPTSWQARLNSLTGNGDATEAVPQLAMPVSGIDISPSPSPALMAMAPMRHPEVMGLSSSPLHGHTGLTNIAEEKASDDEDTPAAPTKRLH